MKKLFSILIILFVTLGMMINDADARRFGGGRSFGMQRSASSYSRSYNAPAAAPTKPGLSKWAAPLAGLAMGGLLASLFMGHGIMSGMLSWLLVGGVIMLVMGWLRSRTSPQTYTAQQPPLSGYQNNPFSPLNAVTANTNTYPNGFDETDFLRIAKVQFMRLQAAYDSKNLADLREFTAPEVFAEIQMQLQERQDAANITEIISLDAKLLDVSSEPDSIIASVEFTGAVREETNGPIEPLNETWHFRKNNTTQKWLLAGLQQN